MATLQPVYRDRQVHSTIPGVVLLSYFAAAFFVLTLLADWAYIQTAILMWQEFAEWLLLAGMVAGGLAVLLWLVGLIVYKTRPHWALVGVNALVLILAFVNNLAHAADGWTAVVPLGIGLSIATVVLILISAFLWRRVRVSHR